MGWLSKGFLALLGFFMLGTGLWFVSLLIFAYIAYGLRPGKRKAERALVVAVQSEDGERDAAKRGRMRGARFEWHWRYAAGASLLVGALLGVAEHGTFSPIVIGGLGLLCFSWAPLSMSSRFAPTALSPIRESILLAPRLVPFVWVAVAEIKLSTQEAARALAVLRDNLIVTAAGSEKPGIFLVLKVIAPSFEGAEARIAARLRRTAALLASRGAYLLPLDSQEVVEKFRQRLEPANLEMDDSVVATIGHSHYDVLVVKPEGSYARSLGAYRVGKEFGADELEAAIAGTKQEAATGGRACLPQPRQKFERRPLLWEVVSSLQERIRFSDPDGYTMLLNNMHLSKDVPLGQRLNLLGGEAGKANGATLTVESLGGTPVELSRAQVRAIVRIYG